MLLVPSSIDGASQLGRGGNMTEDEPFLNPDNVISRSSVSHIHSKLSRPPKSNKSEFDQAHQTNVSKLTYKNVSVGEPYLNPANILAHSTVSAMNTRGGRNEMLD